MSAANPLPLPHASRGRKGPPIVLLHGFGFDAASWGDFAAPLARHRRTVAFDLPGHGGAEGWAPTPHAGAAAKAVVASLEALKIPRAAIVGHSLGGAVAALVGLMRPDLVERLVLIAPGGFGPEMNARHLRRYAAAATPEALAPLVEPFFAPTSPVPPGLVERLAAARAAEPLRRSLPAIVEAISKDDGQGTLPLDQLAAAPFPTSLVWGARRCDPARRAGDRRAAGLRAPPAARRRPHAAPRGTGPCRGDPVAHHLRPPSGNMTDRFAPTRRIRHTRRERDPEGTAMSARCRTAPALLTLMLGLGAPLAPALAAEDCPGDGTQLALNECAAKALQQAEGALDERLSKIRTRLASMPERAKALDAAQTAWTAYRDAECAFAASGVEGGSIQPLVVADCERTVTEARFEALDRYLSCEEGDTTCPVPPQ